MLPSSDLFTVDSLPFYSHYCFLVWKTHSDSKNASVNWPLTELQSVEQNSSSWQELFLNAPKNFHSNCRLENVSEIWNFSSNIWFCLYFTAKSDVCLNYYVSFSNCQLGWRFLNNLKQYFRYSNIHFKC